MRQAFVHRFTAIAALCGLGFAVAATGSQFDAVEVPPQLQALDFMIGAWTVDGAFRNPDHVASDRTLWYLTRGGGVTRFDGSAWTAFAPGESPEADAVLAQIGGSRAEPYEFANRRDARWAQDGFVLILDEGRTSGTTLIYFDTGTSEWVATLFHAPTNGVNAVRAAASEELPVFVGSGSDRRGERVFRRRYEVHDADHYTVRTDVSFDDGTTWIDDQIVQEVRRR